MDALVPSDVSQGLADHRSARWAYDYARVPSSFNQVAVAQMSSNFLPQSWQSSKGHRVLCVVVAETSWTTTHFLAVKQILVTRSWGNCLCSPNLVGCFQCNQTLDLWPVVSLLRYKVICTDSIQNRFSLSLFFSLFALFYHFSCSVRIAVPQDTNNVSKSAAIAVYPRFNEKVCHKLLIKSLFMLKIHRTGSPRCTSKTKRLHIHTFTIQHWL